MAFDPTPQTLAGFLGCAAFLVGLINQGLKLFDRTKEVPPPHQTYATKEEVKGIKDAIAAVQKDADERRRAIYHKLEESEKQLRAEMKSVATEIKGDMNDLKKGIKGDLDGIQDRINELFREMVAVIVGDNKKHK